jgi:tRNA nucleotidyltransferase (CCA-adding enzyme)
MEKSIIKLLNSYGFEAWICGGSARDLYLGNAPNNWDIAIKTDLAAIREKLSAKLISVNDYSTSAVIRYKDTDFTLYPLKKIELVNTYYNYSFTDSLEEDSNSRDFTINALYYNPLTNVWLDFHNSMQDLDNRLIRFIGDPLTRILESKTRMLRAPILSAVLGNAWRIQQDTCDAISKHRLKIATVNPKQIYTELVKLLTRADAPSKAFKLLRFLDLLEDFFPELQRCINVEQTNKAVGLDLFQHIMYAIDSIDKNNPSVLTLRMAALLHDIGKPYTEVEVGGNLHFYNHENVGAYLSEKIMYRWGFSKPFISKVVLLVQNHLFDASPSKSETSIKKLIQKVGTDNIHDLLDLRIADRYGTGRTNIKMDNVNKLRDKINAIIGKQDLEHFKLALSDTDIGLELDKNSEAIDDAKNYLSYKILSGKLQNKAISLKRSLSKINKIPCPLDKPHLFKTWADLQNGAAEAFPDGKLKCGVFCNFICNRKLETDIQNKSV